MVVAGWLAALDCIFAIIYVVCHIFLVFALLAILKLLHHPAYIVLTCVSAIQEDTSASGLILHTVLHIINIFLENSIKYYINRPKIQTFPTTHPPGSL